MTIFAGNYIKYSKNMALNIKRVLKERGLTAMQVAERMGVTNVALSQHMNGNPSVQTLERIAQAIGCDVAELFDPLPPTIRCPHCGEKIVIEGKSPADQ